MPRFIKDVDLWISINLFDHIGWLVQCICPFITCFWLARVNIVVSAVFYAISFRGIMPDDEQLMMLLVLGTLWMSLRLIRALEIIVAQNPRRANPHKAKGGLRLTIVAIATMDAVGYGPYSTAAIVGDIGLICAFYFMAGNPMMPPPKEAPHPLTIAEPPDSPP